jgi:FtsP/CotA-like multicopper oxidase with cupredoxin domain
MVVLKRRQFFLGVASLIATSITNHNPRENQDNSLVAKSVSSRDGLLELDLEAGIKPVNFLQRKAYLMNYNGQLPAPRLEVKAGDTIRINFTNHLEQPTNLHFHGLHVTPNGKGDNPFLHIHPGEKLTYEFTIPKNHRAGTFWYHPHYHHYTAAQVFGGLAGLLIVRGELDEIPEVKAAKTEYLVLQDFAFDRSGQLLSPLPMELMRGREGNLLTVNGQIKPSFSITRNGLLRLRLLNASSSRFYRLSLENHPFYLIATDQGAISQPIELRELLLTPGERAEVLIHGNQSEGKYRLLNLPYNRGGMGMGMMEGHGMGRNRSNENTSQVLATFSYQGTTKPVPLPSQLIPVESLPTPKTVRRLEFSMSMGRGMNRAFLFNGEVYDQERINQTVKLNTIEDWELINLDPHDMDHPFHIHTNPFQVIYRNGKLASERVWKDTILVPSGEVVRIRIPFRNFTGKTVYHCHILDHEDLGMMGIVNIIS